MRKPFFFILVTAAIIGGWHFFQHYEVANLGELSKIQFLPKTPTATSTTRAPWEPPARNDRETIKIASFNIQVFGNNKLAKPQVVDILARIVRQFDIVAVQEIRSRDQDILPRFLEVVNQTGRQYDYVIGPRLGRSNNQEQYAFLFDRTSVEIDRGELYTLEDPQDLLHREPLVGWFRVRGPPANQAFTFTLVNVHTDPDEVPAELKVLDDVFRTIRGDGRGEDDVILLGDFNTDDRHLGELGQVAGIGCVVLTTPTNTRGTHQYDNLVFDQRATTEFVGRGGVFDFLREFNLSLEDALEVSDHLPVWGEFSVFEGGTSGRVAESPLRPVTHPQKGRD